MDPTYPLVPVMNFLAFFLALIPLLSSDLLKKWNVGVCVFATWVAVQSLTHAINFVVWSDNVKNIAPIWCDITTHLDVGAEIAVPACSLTITRRIFEITRIRGLARSQQEKRKEILIDLLICLGPSFLCMALYYVVQGARFQIFEEIGCVTATSAPGLSALVFNGWVLLLSSISVIFYTPRIVWVLYHQRKEVDGFLDSGSSLDRGNYYRIMTLACFDAALTLPIGIIQTAISFRQENFTFYPGWTVVHEHISAVMRVPASVWSSIFWVSFAMRWGEWVNLLFAVVFFLLFGLTERARFNYRRTFRAIFAFLSFRRPAKMNGRASDIYFGSARVVSVFGNRDSMRSASSSQFA